jgi:hypothetical protein
MGLDLAQARAQAQAARAACSATDKMMFYFCELRWICGQGSLLLGSPRCVLSRSVNAEQLTTGSGTAGANGGEGLAAALNAATQALRSQLMASRGGIKS